MDNKTTGFTLIEMLVGIVIGMIVVAAASVMMVSVLKSQKDVTASARLNQELGAVMAVMSNEIRRAGFSVCDIKKMHDAGSNCPNPDGEEVPYITYALGEDLKIGDVDEIDDNGTDTDIDGNCTIYRYNANLDAVDNPQELRGFRLNNNIIQMAGSSGVVKCALSDTTWVDLTDSKVIDVTELSFKTTGSKCRNMTLPDPNPAPEVIAQYWTVTDEPDPDEIQTGLACDNGVSPTSPEATAPVDYCTVDVDPRDSSRTIKTCSGASKTVDTSIVKTGDKLFGTRQILITLHARLTKDQTVSKILTTSVKVANPQIEIAQ